LPRPENPEGPCIPCIETGLAATCGPRTYPPGRKKSAREAANLKRERSESMNKWSLSHVRDINKGVGPAGEAITSLSHIEKKEVLNTDHKLTRYTAITFTRKNVDMIGLPICST